MSVNITRRTAYGLSDPILNVPDGAIPAKRNPTANDKAQIGTVWVNTITNAAFILTSIVDNSANWESITSGGSSLTFDADTGSATPSSNIITFTGGAGVNTSATGSTVTITASGATQDFVLIETQPVSAVSAVDFTSGITTDYTNYMLFINEFVPSLTAQYLYLRISTDGGSTYENTGYFTSGGFGTAGLPAMSIQSLGGDSSLQSGQISLLNFTTGSYPFAYISTQLIFDTTSPSISDQSGTFGGCYGTLATVNAFQLVQDDGSDFSGIFSLYGIRK